MKSYVFYYNVIFTFAIKHFKSLDANVSRAEFGLVWTINCDFQNKLFSVMLLYCQNLLINQTSCPQMWTLTL